MTPDVREDLLTGEEQEFYGAGCASQAWGAPLEELWEHLGRLEPMRPASGKVAAAMVEPLGDGLMRPILAELHKDQANGKVSHVGNIMWGPCTRDEQMAAQGARAMQEAWYRQESMMVVTPDASSYEEQKGISWRVMVELAENIERGVNDSRRGDRQTKLAVDYDDSGRTPCFVLAHVDAHGADDEFARLPLRDCHDIDGNIAGWVTPQFTVLEKMCGAAFGEWEHRQEQIAESLAQSAAAVLGSAVQASDSIAAWLRFVPGTEGVGIGAVAAELGAEGLEYDNGARSWLGDQRRSRLCHRPRVIVSEADGDRKIRVETLNGEGLLNYGMTLGGTFNEVGFCTGIGWSQRRAEPTPPRQPWTAEQLAAFDSEGHNHDIDDELGIGHVCGACEHGPAESETHEYLLGADSGAGGGGTDSLRLGGGEVWRPTIGDVAEGGLEL